MKKSVTMSPIALSRLLIAAMAIIVLLGAAGYYFGTKKLKSNTDQTAILKIDAEVAEGNVERLRLLGGKLASQQDIAQKANQIVAESTEYLYQDQIVEDINAYGARTGVGIIGYNFTAAEGVQSSSTPGTVISGIQAISATVNIASPVKLTNYLKFLKAIEQNLTRMQVTGISMNPDEKDPDMISNTSVELIIYVKA